MSINNASKFNNASTFYSTIFADMFVGDAALDQNFKKYMYIDSQASAFYEVNFLTAFPLPDTWEGKRVYKDLSANTHRIDTKLKQASTCISKLDYDLKPEFVQRQVQNFLAGQVQFHNHIAVQSLIASNTLLGYDGVPLCSTTHPLDNGSFQSNYGTSALNQTTFRAASTAMMGYTDEVGRPLGIVPKKLIVGPKLSYIARDIIEAKYRVQGMTANGAVDANASIVTAGAIDNVVANDSIELIIEPLLNNDYDDYWFLIGERPGVVSAPFIYNIAKDVEPTDTLNTHLETPEYKFSLTAEVSVGAGLWQCIFGNFL